MLRVIDHLGGEYGGVSLAEERTGGWGVAVALSGSLLGSFWGLVVEGSGSGVGVIAV